MRKTMNPRICIDKALADSTPEVKKNVRWERALSQEISKSDPRSVLGGIKNTGCIFPDQFQAFICVSSKKLPASTQQI